MSIILRHSLTGDEFTIAGRGRPGPAPTIKIGTFTLLDPDDASKASVESVSTDDGRTVTFNFALPKGEQGIQGEKGDTGGVPNGGSAGALLVKTSNENQAVQWTRDINIDTVRATKVYGAVWNDYAEYRECDIQEPGRVVCENGDDTLSLACGRMLPGANIISDTFGFAIGETDRAKTPIAVSGRVLAYTFEDRETFKPGEPVCSGPNGTVSKMSREEIINYPECIVGYVSAIPQYERWGENNVKVNNRIWIKVR